MRTALLFAYVTILSVGLAAQPASSLSASVREFVLVDAPVVALTHVQASGVTTIRTTGAFSPYSELNLKSSIAAGELVGPRMYITGPYITGAGAMTQMKAVYELSLPNRPPLEARVLDMMAPAAREEYLQTRNEIASRDESPMATLFPKAQAFEKAFVDAGGLLAAGVDPTGMGGALPGYGDQRNYELLLEAGLTPEQVIQIMTLNGARVLGEDHRFGSIEAGKLADLVVINGDPVQRASEIRNVTLVFKEGVGYDSPKLLDSVKGLVGLR